MQKFWKYLFILLILVLALEFIAISRIPDSKFHIIACNVGQGDATLIIYGKIQILIDGGPDNKVISCLGKYLPFWDRELELVILTHPDSDHFFGLSGVFKKYKVDNYLVNNIKISNPSYEVLENTVGGSGVRVLDPRRDRHLRLGLIQLDILFPQTGQNGSGDPGRTGYIVTDESTNDFSIVSLIGFGKFKALLTGDMNPAISDSLAQNWSGGTVNYIKISHHGSKNGTTLNLLKRVVPMLAVISVGKNNYGQPAPEVLQMLDGLKIKYLRTDKNGNVEIITDGENFFEEKVEQKN